DLFIARVRLVTTTPSMSAIGTCEITVRFLPVRVVLTPVLITFRALVGTHSDCSLGVGAGVIYRACL
ncbi:hypothetical protein, partial [Saccharopolyspora shandongensis]|uniref:hypothetical protein n=1 Tax=Saccharopolyspora shandongensis TaxID=418495 RepID=UPI0033E0515F